MADDVTSMLALARRKAAERRERFDALAPELYGTPRGLLTDSERSLMTGMIHGLVDSVAGALRPRLATRLAGNGPVSAALTDLPLDALMAPLRRASFLSDPDLIDAAYHRLLEYRLETPGRESARAGPPVDAGTSDIVAGLLARASAPVARALTAFQVAEAKRRDAYRNPLLLPTDLPQAAARRLFWAIAAVLRGTLAPGAGETVPDLDDAIESATTEALDAALAGGDPEARPEEVARRLVEAGLAGPATLAPLLGAGEAGLFVAVLSRLTGIEGKLLRRFLFEPGGEALAVCARAIGMGRDDLAAILSATRNARQRPRAVDSTEVSAALELYDRIAVETARHLTRHWARRQEFLWMLGRLEPDGGAQNPRSAHS